MEKVAYLDALKALADENRLKIVDLLSGGTLCACDILDHFDFTQPTLSHHMQVLQNAGIVTAEKSGKWQYYTLVPTINAQIQTATATLFDRQSAPTSACCEELTTDQRCCNSESLK